MAAAEYGICRLLPVVKNLRGVVWGVDEAEVERAWRWLRPRFQYRWLGVPPKMRAHARLGPSEAECGPFVPLDYPSAAYHGWLEEASQGLDEQDAELLESMLLASLFVSPLLVLGMRAAARLGPWQLCEQQAPALSDAEAKRHMRILDYAALDAHRPVTEQVRAALERIAERSHSLSGATAKRACTQLWNRLVEFACKDCQSRFWRLREQVGPLRPTVAYLHPLALIRRFRSQTSTWPALVEPLLRSQLLAASFSIVPAFVVEPAAGSRRCPVKSGPQRGQKLLPHAADRPAAAGEFNITNIIGRCAGKAKRIC